MKIDAAKKVTATLEALLPNIDPSKDLNGLRPLAELELDSLSILEVIYELEDYFGFELSESQLQSLNTIDDLTKAFAKPPQTSIKRLGA